MITSPAAGPPADPSSASLLELVSQLRQGGGSKQQLLTQLLLQQQQSAAPAVAGVPERSTVTDKLRGRFKRAVHQNQQLKQRIARLDAERGELLEFLDYFIELNQGFSAAVGACECWGTEPNCPTCHGRGRSGWEAPDAAAFAEFVRPALDHPASAAPQAPQPTS